MNLLDLFRSTKASTDVETKTATATLLSDPWGVLSPGGSSIAGPAVGPSTAMRVPAVSAAVALIAGAVSSLPVKTYETDAEDQRSTARGHPSYRLVHNEANGWTSAGELRKQLTRDALLHDKGGFAYVNKVQGKPIEMLRLDPLSMNIGCDKTSGEPFYVTGIGRDKRTYAYTDILHIQAPNGIAPISLAKEAIGIALILEQHAAQLFANGARPSGVLRFPKMLGENGIKGIATGWHAAHAGGNSGRTAILEEGGEFQPLSFNSVDSQFAEMRTFQIIEIARAFGVPPHLLFELGRATWSNSEQMRADFLTFSLLPWLDIWEAAYSRVLLSPEERDNTYVEFNTDALISADTATRSTAYASLRGAGVLTANEVRAKENLPPHPDGNTLSSPFTTPASASPKEAAEVSA